MADIKRTDDVTGFETTGHEWDGIEELNRPLPRWWLYTFYACVIWAVGYYFFYPSWPMIGDYTRGLLGYSQRIEVAAAVQAGKDAQAVYRDQIAATELEGITADPELLRFALAGGAAAFGDNCAPCHGSGAAGFKGYPNLNDDDWLWGGTLESIHTTLLHGIRASNDDTRLSDMIAYGRDRLLERDQIENVVHFVRQISGQEHEEERAERGAVVFEENCVACHGEGGVGMVDVGAPNLTDAIWLYGGSFEDLRATLHNGRAGVMPAWTGRLDEVTIKQLTVYVHSLGGGE